MAQCSHNIIVLRKIENAAKLKIFKPPQILNAININFKVLQMCDLIIATLPYFFHFCSTVEPLLYDHPQNHIGVVV